MYPNPKNANIISYAGNEAVSPSQPEIPSIVNRFKMALEVLDSSSSNIQANLSRLHLYPQKEDAGPMPDSKDFVSEMNNCLSYLNSLNDRVSNIMHHLNQIV